MTSGPAQPGRPGSRGPAFLFGGAAVILAAAIVVTIWRRTIGSAPRPVEPAVAESAIPEPSPVPTLAADAFSVPAALPTRGPRAAADAGVGAPREATAVTPKKGAAASLERVGVESFRAPGPSEVAGALQRGLDGT